MVVPQGIQWKSYSGLAGGPPYLIQKHGFLFVFVILG